jgi:hypothetical protein
MKEPNLYLIGAAGTILNFSLMFISPLVGMLGVFIFFLILSTWFWRNY